MCLLTFLPAGVGPDVSALTTGAELNNDGHGFAIVSGRHLDTLIVHRGLHAQDVIDAFVAARAHHRHGPALFHSRLATHGTTDVANCHPFAVGGDARTVLAHNGVLPAVVQPGPGECRSDTRIAAEDFIPALGSLRVRRTRLALQRWMTPHNKMVILTVDRRFKQPAFLLNEDAGIWHDGIWYSNTSFRMPTYRGRYPDWYDTRCDDEGWDDTDRGWRRLVADRCGHCEAIIDVGESSCPWCGWCLDCGELPDLCLCYAPAALDRTGEGSRPR